MRNNEKKILLALGDINEKYLDQARPRERKSNAGRFVAIAASFVLIVSLSLTFVLLGDNTRPTAKAPFGDKNSDYSELIALIDKYKSEEENDFVWGTEDDVFEGGFDTPDGAPGAPGSSAPGNNGSSSGNDQENNGEYIENTENQVAGVTEADLMKMTNKYIFRLGTTRATINARNDYVLRIYSVDKENSKLISEFNIPKLERENSVFKTEMYLSENGKTITVIKQYSDKDYRRYVGVVSVDVSDVNEVKAKGSFSVDGHYSSSRMVDGKLMLFTSSSYYLRDIDFSDPTSFVPTYFLDGEKMPVSPESIICPDVIESLNYRVVTMVNEEDLEIIDAKALLNFTSDLYVSKNNLFMSREYFVQDEHELYGSITRTAYSDVAILGYSDEGFEDKGCVTMPGFAENQYSFDEKDGFLRVVTTTNQPAAWWNDHSASLYIFNIADRSLRASVTDFAPIGEEATSVRFEGDKLYVCTAEVWTFTDPVFFFDLSDYDNITYTDTGYIDGFSTSLIDIGDGYLIGIGREDRNNNKVEVYKEEDGRVVSVDKYFLGNATYAEEYKAYIIDRENNLFGFGVNYFLDSSMGKQIHAFIILQFDGNSITLVDKISAQGFNCGTARAAIYDGYIYLTTTTSFAVKKM